MDGKTAELLAFSRALYIEKEPFFGGDIDDIDDLVDYIARKRNTNVVTISNHTRKQEVRIDRQVTQSICRAYSIKYNKQWSLAKIGEKTANRNHATVLHSSRVVWNMIQTNDGLIAGIWEVLINLGLSKDDLFIAEEKKRVYKPLPKLINKDSCKVCVNRVRLRRKNFCKAKPNEKSFSGFVRIESYGKCWPCEMFERKTD